MMQYSLKLDLPDWASSPSVQKLMKVIGGFDDVPHSMFVGGCVRNTLIKEAVSDIDIATKILPEDIIKKCQSADIKVIPTGIDHGTVTTVIDGQSFEVTTLRTDDETDGRRAKVSYTNDWLEDAKRRDFTINTLLMDMAGHVYDPTALGLRDIEARHIIFVGEAAKRIEEDYLRILRFFRFYGQYGEGQMDEEALKACALHGDKISTLSRERITSEFLKILDTKKAPQILDVMFNHNVLSDLKDNDYNSIMLERLISFQEERIQFNTMSRLLVMSGNKARFFDAYLRLSHAQKNFLIKLDMASNSDFYDESKALKKAIYYHGRELMAQGYLVYSVKTDSKLNPQKLDILDNWVIPECPITGDALIKEGYVTGPDLGAELKIRQEEWLEEKL